MNIKKNISATLKREMDKRKLNCAEFSKEFGIPRTTLQGYLKGTSFPRADSMELLTEKLGISLSELVSGEESFGGVDISCLDPLFSELPSLHPRALPIAQDAISLLQTAFHLSSSLYAMEQPETLPESPDDFLYRYFVHEMRCPFRQSPSYGILVKAFLDERWVTIAIVAPFSDDRAAVLRLSERCTNLQLSPEQLLDVVQDFLTQSALPS